MTLIPRTLLAQESEENSLDKIKFGVSSAFPPIQYQSEDGEFAGITTDIIRLISNRLNIQPELSNLPNWDLALNRLNRAEIDVIAGIVITEERKELLHFTRPYLVLPVVIFTRTDFKSINGVNSLNGALVGVIEGSFIDENLKRDLEDYKPSYTKDFDESLRLLSDGEVDAILDVIPTFEHSSRRLGIDGLRVAATSPYTLDLAMAVSKNRPELVAMMRSEILNLSEAEKTLIYEKWTNVEVRNIVNWRLMLFWGSGIILLASGFVAMVLYWNRKLKSEIQIRQKIQNRLQYTYEKLQETNVDLTESENKYKTLIENIQEDYMIYSMDEQGKFQYLNPGAEKILGKPLHGVINHTWEDAICITATYKGVKEITSKIDPLVNENRLVEFVDPSNNLKILEISQIPSYDNNGKLQGVNGIAKDITSAKKKEAEMQKAKESAELTLEKLEKTQSQLVQSEKMAALGILTAGMAHEINNPLNFIKSGTEILKRFPIISTAGGNISKRDKEDIESINSVLKNMEVGVDRIADIVRSLNSFSYKDSQEISPCNVHKIIRDCLTILSGKHMNRIRIETNFSDQEVIVNGNSSKLYQVFSNLLANSIQAISGRGEILIKTVALEKNVEVFVEDSGVGISQKDLNRIFDPFFTTKDPGEGTGLGLSIVYKIMEEIGGSIHYDSVPEKGTKVTLRFKRLHSE